MKSFIVALLIASTSAVSYLGEPTWTLKSLQDHRTDSKVQDAYAAHSTAQANGRPPYQSAVQLWALFRWCKMKIDLQQ